MVTVHDVAAYILNKRGPMTAMKLQKLCYFSYGYHLAWEDRQLFNEPFEAWANGPVAPALYACHRGRFNLNAGEIEGDPEALDDGERETIDIVLEAFDGFTAQQLSDMSHAPGPWTQARERAGAGPMQRTNERLKDEDIADYFGALIKADADA